MTKFDDVLDISNDNLPQICVLGDFDCIDPIFMIFLWQTKSQSPHFEPKKWIFHMSWKDLLTNLLATILLKSKFKNISSTIWWSPGLLIIFSRIAGVEFDFLLGLYFKITPSLSSDDLFFRFIIFLNETSSVFN